MTQGMLTYETGHAKPGATVDLRFEMDTLVVLNTCPHPLDPAETYAPKPVLMEVSRSSSPASDDICRTSRPENVRAFENTEQFYLLSQS